MLHCDRKCEILSALSDFDQLFSSIASVLGILLSFKSAAALQSIKGKSGNGYEINALKELPVGDLRRAYICSIVSRFVHFAFWL